MVILVPGRIITYGKFSRLDRGDDDKKFKDRKRFYCAYCGRRLGDDLKCPDCKEKFIEEDYDPERPLYSCPHCNSKISKIGSYCSLCGAELD
jgi:predicted amidophosphoribosyltransferase